MILYILLTGAFICSCYYTFKHFRTGSACCEVPEATKKIPVKDRNKKHYSYHYQYKIMNMTCTNCATIIENALNCIDGTYAKVNYNKRIVNIYSKTDNEKQFISAIHQSGYSILKSDF